MKLVYRPFSLIAGAVAARIGKATFRGLWSRIDSAEPPAPTAEDASLPKVVGAAALEAATMAGASAVVNRITARTFKHLTGISPESEKPERD